MSCFCKKDHDLRMKKAKAGVIHAAVLATRGGYDTQYYDKTAKRMAHRHVPKREVIELACQREIYNYDEYKDKLVNKTETITCKKCQLALGFIEKKFEQRYVLVNTKENLFFKKAGYNCTNWVEDLYSATLYKNKAAAEDYGSIEKFYENGKEIKRIDYYQKRHKKLPNLRKERIMNENRAVKPVIIMLEEEYNELLRMRSESRRS